MYMESGKIVLMEPICRAAVDRLGEQTCGHSGGGRGWDELKSSVEKYTLPHVKWVADDNLLYDEGSSNLVLCDNTEG